MFIFEQTMQKPAFCINKNKGAYQLYSTAQLIRAFVFSTEIVFCIPNFKPLAIFCSCTAWFVSDLVRNPKDRFSRDKAHLNCITRKTCHWGFQHITRDLKSMIYHDIPVGTNRQNNFSF